MLKRTIFFAYCIVFLSHNIIGKQLQSSFDTDSEGWRFEYDVTLTWQSSGGNPGGFLQGKDHSDGRTWYYVTPADWTGDWLEYNCLSFDLKIIISSGGLFDHNDIIIIGTNGDSLVAQIEYPTTSWTNYSLILSPLTFGTTENEYKNIMANVSKMMIRGEYINGTDTEGLDNVSLSTGISTQLELNKKEYQNGDDIIIQGTIDNKTDEYVSVEVKTWYQLPTESIMSFIDPHTVITLEPNHTFSHKVFQATLNQNQPEGTYHIGIRILNPLTGEEISHDFKSFTYIH